MLMMKLTNEQYSTLMDVMEREWDAELKYQEESVEPDTVLLDKYLDVLDNLQHMPVRNVIEKVVADDLIAMKREQVNKLKERRHI